MGSLFNGPARGPIFFRKCLCASTRALMPNVFLYTWHLWTLWRVCDKRGREQERNGRQKALWAGLAKQRQRYCRWGSMPIRNGTHWLFSLWCLYQRIPHLQASDSKTGGRGQSNCFWLCQSPLHPYSFCSTYHMAPKWMLRVPKSPYPRHRPRERSFIVSWVQNPANSGAEESWL